MSPVDEPRFQLVPPGPRARAWLFTLCLLLPLVITAATLAIPASALAATPQGPTPAGNPGEWVTTGDYPADALQAGATGTV